MRYILLSLLAATAAGCGGEFETGRVNGVIYIAGTPLENASVTFVPKAKGSNVPASNGRTDARGAYDLAVTMTGDRGAVLGRHTVIVSHIPDEGVVSTSDAPMPAYVDPLPDHQFSFDVKPGKNEATFHLGEVVPK